MMPGQGRFNISLYHTYRIQDEITIRDGLPVLESQASRLADDHLRSELTDHPGFERRARVRHLGVQDLRQTEQHGSPVG